MADATARIRNLSIALARLSIKSHNSKLITDRIYGLLSHEIAKEEERIATATPPARPAEPTSDDDIPF